MGLTLDTGHLLMAGENPAQSIAAAAKAGRLFGIQLCDGHSRLGSEDGLMFGAVHTTMALEVGLHQGG
jgi:sugar phosphate isomerase/epimerase